MYQPGPSGSNRFAPRFRLRHDSPVWLAAKFRYVHEYVSRRQFRFQHLFTRHYRPPLVGGLLTHGPGPRRMRSHMLSVINRRRRPALMLSALHQLHIASRVCFCCLWLLARRHKSKNRITSRFTRTAARRLISGVMPLSFFANYPTRLMAWLLHSFPRPPIHSLNTVLNKHAPNAPGAWLGLPHILDKDCMFSVSANSSALQCATGNLSRLPCLFVRKHL